MPDIKGLFQLPGKGIIRSNGQPLNLDKFSGEMRCKFSAMRVINYRGRLPAGFKSRGDDFLNVSCSPTCNGHIHIEKHCVKVSGVCQARGHARQYLFLGLKSTNLSTLENHPLRMGITNTMQCYPYPHHGDLGQIWHYCLIVSCPLQKSLHFYSLGS